MNSDTMQGMEDTKEKQVILQPSHVRLYRFVEKYIAKHIVSPEITEIATAIKLTERQSYRLVEDLCFLGYLSKEKHRKRSIRIESPLR